jgi:protein-tyrosine phosphatase
MRSKLLLLLLLPSLAGAQTVASDTSSIHLDGVINFRDIGGIATADGHKVRAGVYFRSAELSHLTEADLRATAPLHVRYIFDLRTDVERATDATHWTENAPTIVPISVGMAANEPQSASIQRLFAKGTDPAHVNEAMRNLTAQIALDGAPAIGDVLRDLAKGDEPAIVHCTAGKDRTGVVTAVLLRILGVPMESIYADYVRSNEAVPAEMAHLRAAAASAPAATLSPLASLPPESIKILMGVDRSYLEAAFAAIDQKYGTFDTYVSNGLMLTPKDVQALRTQFLEPSH